MTRNELKFYSSLKQKKYRELHGQFLIEGIKIVEEAVRSDWKILRIFCTHEFSDKNDVLISKIEKTGNEIARISTNDFERIADSISPQGIAASIKIEKREITSNSGIIAALFEINDPGNLGTIIRTCDWFGISEIIVSGGSVDIFNPKVLRSTMGSFFHVNISIAEGFSEKISELKNNGWQINCADLEGENIYSTKIKNKSIVIFSSESHGPSSEIINLSDQIITIPKYGEAESLNVAGSAAIILGQLKHSLLS